MVRAEIFIKSVSFMIKPAPGTRARAALFILQSPRNFKPHPPLRALITVHLSPLKSQLLHFRAAPSCALPALEHCSPLPPSLAEWKGPGAGGRRPANESLPTSKCQSLCLANGTVVPKSRGWKAGFRDVQSTQFRPAERSCYTIATVTGTV